jgi:glycosyltransferase involved in cell wall biosynthesis
MRVLIIGAHEDSLIRFRGELLKTLVIEGHTVFACADGPAPAVAAELLSYGVTYHPISLARAGLNPLADLRSLLDLANLMRHIRPNIVLAYTIKPVIYGSFAAALCGISATYSMIEGLGYPFMEFTSPGHRLTRLIATILYKMALRKNRRVFFLNPDDQKLFLDLKLVRQNQICLINGIGVDLNHYSVVPLPSKDLAFLLIARLLRVKGIVEYVEAAKKLKAKYPQIKFGLVGMADPNPAGVTPDELQGWIKSGVIEYHGYLEDVRPAIAASSVYVLPSFYREGLPRTILEAMAMGRPIITTDSPGCRESIKRNVNLCISHAPNGVIAGENGFLVPIKNAQKLAEAMEQFILNPELIDHMGACSRQIAVEKYDVHKVNAVILRTMGLA